MTLQELHAAWERYMHRTDLKADLDTVYLMASTRISERLLVTPDLTLILENNPRMLVHGGMIYLHELARDTEGQQAEMAHFEQAAQDYTLWRSRQDRPRIDPFTYDAAGTP